ncbi:MAG: F0F1 ATP synthase subunit A [Pirellulales bacterium]|nr:F0F1 ATP synthase subunit A [Pirellulales bacterium]
MADPILHIKDAYYFQVPRSFWRYDSLEEVPQFLRDAHPKATIEEFAHAIDGKVIIPQPFGELKNLYEAASGFCISKFMIVELVVAIIIAAVFIRLAQRMQSGNVPRGRGWNMLEAMLLYFRDNVARSAIGKKDGDAYLPLLWTIFFFILGCNLAGMVPWVGAPTGAWAVTLSLALVILVTVLVAGAVKLGPVGFWKNMIPHIDLPWPLAVPIKAFIFLIEVGGLLIKHAVLSIRLLANMVAGHVVLLGIMTAAISVEMALSNTWWVAMPVSVGSATLFSCLEIFVAFLQAYIFTFLSALFIGMATHHH